MALTRVSPALFATSNNITSTTVGGSANTVSLTFDGSGVITSATNNAISVANTAITGNIISSQITSVANTQITGNIISSQITSVANTQITGVLPITNGGTGAATLAGADIAVTTATNSFTGTQTFTGTSSALAIVLNDAAEVVNVSATAATGTINYDITTQSVLYYTTNASGNWTINFRASSGTSLNTAMTTGQSVTAAFLATQGSTAYYNNVVQVDGSTVTPKYQGGTAPTSGNASSVDAYSYTIIKTGNAAFTIFASQLKFA